jgi:hypothetical protein
VKPGVVLFYSPGDHGYLIQFDAKELGCEFCPDADVASVKTTFMHSALDMGSLSDPLSQDLEVIPKDDSALERYSLALLLANIERAKERKKAILEAMRENNASLFRRHHPDDHVGLGNDRADPFSAFQRSTSAWLHANLILCNGSLRKSLELLRSAYSEKSKGADLSRYVFDSFALRLDLCLYMDEEMGYQLS